MLYRQSSEPELSMWKKNLNNAANEDDAQSQLATTSATAENGSDQLQSDTVDGSVMVSTQISPDVSDSPLQVTVASSSGNRTRISETGAAAETFPGATTGDLSTETSRSSHTTFAETSRPSITKPVDAGSTSLPVNLVPVKQRLELDLGPSTSTREPSVPDKSTIATANPLEFSQDGQQNPAKTVDPHTLPASLVPGNSTVLAGDVSQTSSSSLAGSEAGIVTSVAASLADPLLDVDDNYSLHSHPATDLLPSENIQPAPAEPYAVCCNKV